MTKKTNEWNWESFFPKRLKALMNENNTKQTELADVIGVTRQAVSKWINGEAIPDLASVIKIAEFYKVSIDSLAAEKPFTQIVNEATEKKEITIEAVGGMRFLKLHDAASRLTTEGFAKLLDYAELLLSNSTYDAEYQEWLANMKDQ